MFLSKNHEQTIPEKHEQTILELFQGDYISATADSFLIDRQAREKMLRRMLSGQERPSPPKQSGSTRRAGRCEVCLGG